MQPLGLMTSDARARFLHFVVVDPSGCWLWRGHTVKGGYGRFCLNGRQVLAHRAAYEGTVGPIPVGLTMDHLCNRPPCANPAHLEPVTQAENNRRAGLGWWWRDRTHCVNGHPFSGANTYIELRRGGTTRARICRACRRDAVRRYRARRAAA